MCHLARSGGQRSVPRAATHPGLRTPNLAPPHRLQHRAEDAARCRGKHDVSRMSTPESPRSRSGFSSASLMSAGEAATLRARPVVGTDTSRLRYLRLHQTPAGRRAVAQCVQDDRWTSVADAMDMQSVTADIDQLTGGPVFLLIIPCSDCLENES